MEELPSNAVIQYRSAYDGTLTPEDIKKAEVELRETKEAKEKCLKTLREMLKGDAELTPRTEDTFLLRFLRVRKFDCDRAFQLIQNYYASRLKYGVYQNFLPSTLRYIFDQNRHTILPYRDPEGRAIIVVKIGLAEPSPREFQEDLQAGLLCLERCLDEEATQINGFLGIFDFTGLSLAHVRHLVSVSNAMCITNVLQNGIPTRLKGLHFVNEPWFTEVGYAIVRPFVSEKNSHRIFFHGTNMASLYKYFPRSVLPEEYGGLLGPMNNKEWTNRLMGSEDSFLYDQNFGYLKRKKQKKQKSFFGLL